MVNSRSFSTIAQLLLNYGQLSGTPDMDWDYPTPFTHQLTVSRANIDGMGHANNACYVVWCEDCAWKHSGACQSIEPIMSTCCRVSRTTTSP